MSYKRSAVALALTLGMVLGIGAPAGADHGYYDDDCRGGGCGTEREEEYGDQSCKYFCPDLKDSPVQTGDITICMPFSACRQPEGDDRPPPGR